MVYIKNFLYDYALVNNIIRTVNKAHTSKEE